MRMSLEQVERYADMFSAMGTEPRLRIMQLLLSAHPEGLVVGEIQEELEIPSSTLSHHLDKLKNEGLVNVQRESTFLRYTAEHRRFARTLEFSLFRVLHAQQGGAARSDRTNLQVGEFRDERYGYQRSCQRKVRAGRAAGEERRQLVLWIDRRRECGDPITSNLYDAGQASQIPEEALLASLGCGNPTALAQLSPGEMVLDLGSGGGIDVLLSAQRVGPTGKAYGLDMTDEMLALANENKRKAGAENVEFLAGRSRTSRCRTTRWTWSFRTA